MTSVGSAISTKSDRVRGEQARRMYAQAAVGLVVSGMAGIALALFLWLIGDVGPLGLTTWVCILLAQTAGRLLLFRAFRRAQPVDSAWRSWTRAYTLGALVGGITWGAGSLWMIDPGHFDQQLLIVLVICALTFGAFQAFSGHLPSLLAFAVPALVPSMLWSALQPGLEHKAYAVLCALWLPTIALLARDYGRVVLDTLALRYENIDLVESLQQQKDVAEQANLAKSRFLAAASHDLRQPVHALSMFVGALRTQPMAAQSARLLEQIEASVGALDGLFGSLLDISRLDAGLVGINRAAISLHALLERVCRDQESAAAAKGLTLRICATSAVVDSDPALLERILRNLVSNAVRHTRSGKVLVGCRRRGERIGIEVHDSGPGIAPEQQEAIFHEFYQIGRPGQNHSEGLGLGLAIVRRLTRLLGHPLTLRSALGRGTCFGITVPRTAAEARATEPAASRALMPARRLVLVIDDEPAIREATVLLLESWGHAAIAAASGDEAIELSVGSECAPDLIICDYRLGLESGLAAIPRLRDEFNREVPALLISGDTAADRLAETERSGLPLLHKPLSGDKLRAALDRIFA